MKTALGTELHPTDRAHVLAAYVHRYTGDHKPQWAVPPRINGEQYKPQFRDDNDWLANTRFRVKANGRLHAGAKYCESSPTWPQGI